MQWLWHFILVLIQIYCFCLFACFLLFTLCAHARVHAGAYVYVCTCHRESVLFPPCGSWLSDLVASTLPAEPFHWPCFETFLFYFVAVEGLGGGYLRQIIIMWPRVALELSMEPSLSLNSQSTASASRLQVCITIPSSKYALLHPNI